MPKRPFLAVLLCGTALVLVLSFKTPELTSADAGSRPGVVGDPSASTGSASARSGTFDGTTIQTDFGPVQVRVTVQSGRIANVEALQYPSGDPHSLALSRFAMPKLIQETLQAQSSRVNAISGATTSSHAFIRSLQSALSQAGM